MSAVIRFVTIAAALALLAACSSAVAPSPTLEYTVDLAPEDFVTLVDNPYFPLKPETVYVYESSTGEGVEHITVEVLSETRVVMGIQATIVHDTVFLDGVLIEDTYDWYAQDTSGNVWYLGEAVANYENGQYAGDAGSWEAGVDGALPGIIMFGDPAAHVGETYRQEYYAGEAEDMADLLGVAESITIPLGSFSQVVLTLDYTPLEPDLREAKYYAPGIGLVREVNVATGEELVLTEFHSPTPH